MTAVLTASSAYVQSTQHTSRRATVGLIKKMEHRTIGTAPAASFGITGIDRAHTRTPANIVPHASSASKEYGTVAYPDCKSILSVVQRFLRK